MPIGIGLFGPASDPEPGTARVRIVPGLGLAAANFDSQALKSKQSVLGMVFFKKNQG